MKRSTLALLDDLEAEFGPLTQRERRRVVLGIRGGATDKGDELDVDALLGQAEALDALEDGDLEKLEADLVAAGLGLLEGDKPNLEGAGRVNDALEKVRSEVTTRTEKAAEVAAEAIELAKKIKGETGDEGDGEDADADKGDDDAEGDDDKADGDDADKGDEADDAADKGAEGDDAAKGDSDAGDADADAGDEDEKLAASGKPRVGKVNARRPQHATPRDRGPANRDVVLRASANVPGIAAGEVLDTPDKVFNAFREVLRSTAGYRGPAQNFPVMTVGAYDAADLFGEDRTLRDNPRENAKRIAKMTNPEALRASGGRCAPTPIDYTQNVLGVTDRPVKGALLNMGADRGGVVLQPMPTLSDVEGSFGVWTLANDATPGSDGGTDLTGANDDDGPETKSCLVLTCDDPHEWTVDALTTCLKIGNMRKTFWAESVDSWISKSATWFARAAETRLLGKMAANMTHVTETGVLGTARAVLAAIDLAAVGMRQRQRLEPTHPVGLIAPVWLLNAMITDLMREHPGAAAERLAVTSTEIEGFIKARGINVTWSLDGVAGQVFPAQANNTVLRQFPSHVELYLFIEGQEIFLDSGRLDFGVVRDSVLLSTNDFQMFSETMEGYAFHGEEHIRLTLGICSNGSTSGFDEAALDLCSVS